MKCFVCSRPDHAAFIDEQRRAQVGVAMMSRLSKAAGLNMTAPVIQAHLDHGLFVRIEGATEVAKVLGGAKAPATDPAPENEDAPSTRPTKGHVDLVEAIHSEALALLNAGEVSVTIKDGLAAAALIDKRREKEEDRRFVFRLAQLLSGGGGGAPSQLTEGAIEGQARDVTPEEPAGPNPMLAPAHLISTE